MQVRGPDTGVRVVAGTLGWGVPDRQKKIKKISQFLGRKLHSCIDS